MDAVFALADRVLGHRLRAYRRQRRPGRDPAPTPRCAGPISERRIMGALLEVEGVTAFYGASQALFGVDLHVAEGEAVALMGRNGMGKTTTIHTVCRMMPHREGRIAFAGRDLARMPSHEAARLGLGLVPEGRRCFPTLTVRENLIAAARPGPWSEERVLALFPQLARRRGQRANTLSGGEQQMLAIGRAADHQSAPAHPGRGDGRAGAAGAPRDLVGDRGAQGRRPLHSGGRQIAARAHRRRRALRHPGEGRDLLDRRRRRTDAGAGRQVSGRMTPPRPAAKGAPLTPAPPEATTRRAAPPSGFALRPLRRRFAGAAQAIRSGRRFAPPGTGFSA